MLHVVAAATIRATSTGLARAVTTTTAAVFTGSFDGFLRAEVVTLVDPNLNTHDTVGRVGFARGIVNVGTKRLQRHTAFAVPLVTGDVSASCIRRAMSLLNSYSKSCFPSGHTGERFPAVARPCPLSIKIFISYRYF